MDIDELEAKAKKDLDGYIFEFDLTKWWLKFEELVRNLFRKFNP